MAADPTRDDLLRTYVPEVLLAMPEARPSAWETDGTLVFADVSGFTRLTEKLTEQGKIGAEQIVTAISRIWTALLSASDDGGDVLKFGGDALLLLYEGDDHAARAVHAALAMQRALREVSRVETPRGPVRLRMSVGVHAGRQQLVVCGDEHLELFTVGDGATRTVETEAIAEAGQVLVSAATARRLGLDHVGDAPVQVRHQRAAPSPPRRRQVRSDPEAFLPARLRRRLARGLDEHEHRRASIGFVHLGNVDDLLRRRGLDGLLGPLQEVTSTVQRVLDEYGVLLTCTDIGADGVKFMVAAGVPQASEDDAGRVLRALHDIVEQPLDDGLVVRAGANTGNVFAGIVGAPSRRTWSTMGDATNLAARMMGKAPWGAVLATRTTLDESRSRFSVTAVEPMFVKGKTAPVDAALVGAPSVEPARVALSRPTLVGRDAELAALVDALEEMREGRGGAVEVVGEMGSGRTRMVDELRERAVDVPWLGTTCQPYDRTTPYRTARVLLRRVLGIPQDAGAATAGDLLRLRIGDLAPELLPWLPLLAIPAGAAVADTPETSEIDPRFRQTRTQQVVLELLDRAARGPAVVVIEDVDDADEASLDLLAHLVREGTTTHPWLVVTTRRRSRAGLTPDRAPDTAVVDLPPLDAGASTRLVAEIATGTPIPPHLQPQVVERGAGNPLFLIELARAAGDGRGELPPSVGAIVAARVDALGPRERRALCTVSVLGTSFPRVLRDELLTPLGLDPARLDDDDRLRGLFTTGDETCRFANDLVQEVVYERLPYERRRELHGLAADVLLAAGADADLGPIPLHLARAERWQSTWQSARDAAADARADGANATAGELYELALDAARHLDLPDDDVADVAEAAGDVWEHAAVYDRALEAYAEARGRRDGVARTRVTTRIGLVHERTCRYTQAVRWHRRAIRELDALGVAAPADRAEMLAGVAAARFRQGRLDDCVRECERAEPLAVEGGDDVVLAHVYYLLTAAHADLGNERAAARYRGLSLPVYERTGDLVQQGFVLNNMGVDAYFAEHLERSIELYERARDRLRRAGDVVGAAMSANNIAESLIELDRVDDAVPLLEEALRTWRGARYAIGVALATRNLGVVARSRGDLDSALVRFTDARATFAEIDAQAFVVETDAMIADIAAQTAPPDRGADGTDVDVDLVEAGQRR